MLQVAAGLPELLVGQVRGMDEAVALRLVLVAPVILQAGSDEGTVGMPDHQAGTDFVLDVEQIQIPAELSVISLLGQFDPFLVAFFFLLGRKGNPVDPLQVPVRLIALPVGTRKLGQLHRPNGSGGGQMGPGAQVLEVPLLIKTEFVSVHVLRQLYFQLLIFPVKVLQGIVPREVPPLERQVLTDEVLHDPFDVVQFILRQGPGEIEIVVEALLDRRPHPQLDLLRLVPEVHLDRLGQHVGRGVPVNRPTIFVLRSQKVNRLTGLNLITQVQQTTVGAGSDRPFDPLAFRQAADGFGLFRLHGI